MKNLMSLNLNNINLSIVGKPNSGNLLYLIPLGKKSDVGDEYGLTKKMFRDDFIFNNYIFSVIDTPGLRRKSKVKNINEEEIKKLFD